MKQMKKLFLVFAAVVVVALMAVPAVAQEDPYGNGGPNVKGDVIVNTDSSQPDNTVAGDTGEPAQRPGTSGAILPFTGGDVLVFVLIGGAAVLLGTMLVRRSAARREV